MERILRSSKLKFLVQLLVLNSGYYYIRNAFSPILRYFSSNMAPEPKKQPTQALKLPLRWSTTKKAKIFYFYFQQVYFNFIWTKVQFYAVSTEKLMSWIINEIEIAQKRLNFGSFFNKDGAIKGKFKTFYIMLLYCALIIKCTEPIIFNIWAVNYR